MKNLLLGLIIILTLYINEDVLSSFEKVENKFSGKVWHTVMYSPEQNFFNSIWLTDNEFGLLIRFGKVLTRYKDSPLIIDLYSE